jgi:hypothetical protein
MAQKSGILTLVFIVLVLLSPGVSFAQNYVVIGDDDGDGVLFYPRQVEEGPDGNIYVLDTGDSFIKVFSADGEFLRRIGGEGEGPGEFQRADGASFGFTPDGKLCFTEFLRGHRWLTFMELSGDLDRVFSPQLEVGYGITRAVPLKDGDFLVHFAFSSMPEKISDYFLYKRPQALVRLDAEGNVVSEIVKTEYVGGISFVGDGAESSLPYTPVFAWSLLENETVVYSDGMSRSMKVFELDGRLVRDIETDLPEPEKVISEDLDAWRQRRKDYMMQRNPSWYHEFGRVIEKYTKSLYDKPNVSTISATPDGNILVACPRDPKAGNREYLLVDTNGKTLADVRLNAGSLRISQHFVLFLRSDEEGNILVHRVERTGNETADLLALGTLTGPE